MTDLKDFLRNQIKQLAFKNAQDDDSLLHSKILDSISVVDLAVAIEDEYAIKINHTEIVPDNFETINHIVRFLSSKGING